MEERVEVVDGSNAAAAAMKTIWAMCNSFDVFV